MMPQMLRKILVALVLIGIVAGFVPRSAPAIVPAVRPDDAKIIRFDLLDIPLDPPGQTLRVSNQFLEEYDVTFNDSVAQKYFDDMKDLPESGATAIHQCASSQLLECTDKLVMTFTAPQRYVGMFVGFDGTLPESKRVTLTAFDAEIGAPPIGQASVLLGPSDADADYIPAKDTELEFTTPGAPIWRVEVGFADEINLAPELVFDTVAFAPFIEGDSQTLPEECPEDVTRPTVVMRRPQSGRSVPQNVFLMSGYVTTSPELIDATLTAKNGTDTNEQSVLGKVIDPGSGGFAKRITNLLFPGRNTLTLTVVNCAGPSTARAVIDYDPSAGDTRFTMMGLEVTQAIQDLDNSVPLIAGKRTFVRVYLATTGSNDVFTDVTGYLTVCRVASAEATTCGATLGRLSSQKAITVDSLAAWDDLPAKRRRMQSALLFELPLDWTTEGRLRFELDPKSLSPGLPCENCDNLDSDGDPQSYAFQPAEPLTVNIVSVAFTEGVTEHKPADIDRLFLESWLRRAYPISELRTAWIVNEIRFPHGRPACTEVGLEMFGQQAIIIASGGYDLPPTRFYGLVPLLDAMPGRGGAGCALTDDDDPANDHYASGPAGTDVDFTWDRDGSFADFYGAHEIAHTFGRVHPQGCGDAVSQEPSIVAEEFPLGRIEGKDKKFMGFDAGDGQYDALETRLYRGDHWYDVMTYCPNIWISPHSYKGLLATPTPMPVETPTPTPTPVPDSDDNVVAIEIAAESPNDFGDGATPTAGQEVLVVLGTIALDEQGAATVDLKPFTVVPGSFTTPQDEKGSFSIILKDADADAGNDALVTHLFEPRRFVEEPTGTPQLAMLGEVVPWDDRTDTIEILQGGTLIATQTVSDNDPVVDITSPTAGQRFQGSIIPVTWTAEDDVGEELSYSLLYSTDGGTTWQSIASGMRETHYEVGSRIRETQYDVDSRLLPGSDRAIFRVIATDGVLTGEDRSDAFVVEPNPPEVGIISPGDGTRFGRTETIGLVGTATDVGRGTLDDAALTWTADDGTPEQRALGTGRSVSVTDLTPGRHTLTLTATSADGVSATATVSVRIVEDNPPSIDLGDSDTPLGEDRGPEGLFLYDNEDEAGTFYVNNGGGEMEPLRTFDVLLNGWSAVVPGNFGGDSSTDLLFYASDLGVGEFYASDGQGGLQLLSGNEGFTQGWDLIVPGDFDGQDLLDDLFFYDREEGIGKFYTTDGVGRIQLLGTPVPLAHEWTSIVAEDFNGDEQTDLLFYDQATGLAQLSTTGGQGGLEPLSDDVNLTAGWDQIVSGTFDDTVGTDLFLFNTETGDAAFSTTDGEGGLALGSGKTLTEGWTSLLGGDFGGGTGHTDLFFYDQDEGVGTFYATDGAGGLEELHSMDGIGAGWDVMVPGQFGAA